MNRFAPLLLPRVRTPQLRSVVGKAVFFSLCFAITGQLRSETNPGRRVFHATEFVENADLVARPGQSILLDSELADSWNSEPEVRYELERGRHNFCLKGGDRYYTGVAVIDSRGRTLFKLRGPNSCRSVEVRRGVFTLHVFHSDGAPDSTRLTFLDVDEPGAPLHDGAGNPLGGFWGISSTAYDGGFLTAQAPPRNLGSFYTNDMPMIVGGNSWDESSLISFPPTGPPLPLGPPGFFLDMTYSGQVPFVMINGNHQCPEGSLACNFFGQDIENDFYKLQIKDLGHSQFTLGFNTGDFAYNFVQQSTQYFPTTVVGKTGDNGIPPPGANFWLKFRYYPDSSKIGTLNQGEAAFFASCNYEGQGVVTTNDLEPWTYNVGNGVGPNSYYSVRLGNNTTVQINTTDGNGNISPAFFVMSDTSCLPQVLDNASLVYPLDKIIDGTGTNPTSCPRCRLVSANLYGFNMQDADWHQADMTGATLTDVQFTGGTDLSGAKFIKGTLTNVVFAGSTLTAADFTGATLTCVDLSGTAASPRDLTKTTLANIRWQTNGSCVNNLSYTVLTTAMLPPAVWKTANLDGASIVDLSASSVLSTQANPLDLTGVILAQVDFRQASLDYALMSHADLTGAKLRHCSLRHTNLANATLYGAVLDNANLDGANLSQAFLNALPNGSAATLVGAFLRNANLAGAQLSGANFTNADFFGSTAPGTCAIASGFTQNCASAAGATLNNTIFAGALLFGVDFSASTIQGVQFGNAIVIGANFTEANLSGDTQVGTGSGFPGAFLQGTDLVDAAKLQNISLLNAYLDFSGANAFTMQLSGNHTVFPGWQTPGKPVCIQLSYGNGSTVPVNNNTMTCPDGSQPSTGCGAMASTNTAWESQVDISSVGSYQFPATYTPASQPFCQANPNWFTGGIENGSKHRRTPRDFNSTR